MDQTGYKKDSIRMSKVFEISINELEEVLSRKRANTDVTKLAAVSLSAYSKIRATEVHEMALFFAMDKQKKAIEGK